MLFAHPETAFRLTMSDFGFPALPKPGENDVHRQRQQPFVINLNSRDEIKGRLVML